jgi:Recombination endonuclease VII
MKKKTQCKRGHDTTSIDSRHKDRSCKACKSDPERMDEANQRRRAQYVPKRIIKTHCKNGHDVTALGSRDSSRRCKVCMFEKTNSPEMKVARWHRNLRDEGWTSEMWEQTLIEQGNVCALCRKPFTEVDYACADHKHVNPPEPRGILHMTCNFGIGHFKDDPATMRAAADYIESWS